MNRHQIVKIMVAVILFCSCMSGVTLPVAGNGVNISNAQAYDRIMFVIDCSNSMNYQDANKLVNELIKMFVDGVNSQKTDIGFITYNDQILKTYPLTPIASEDTRVAIKEEINQIQRTGSTDIGLALNRAMDEMTKNPKENSQSTIILFSDGETDLTSSKTGRTDADSAADEQAAYEKAKEMNCRIYTVGISKNGTLNTEYLEKIAQSANGKKYAIQHSDELLSLFETLFKDVTGITIGTKDPVAGTGRSQIMTIDIPSKYVSESNIILQHQLPLENVSIERGGNEGTVYTSPNFTSIKLTDPKQDRVTVRFTASSKDKIKENVINFINVSPEIKKPDNLASKTIKIEAQMKDNNSKEIITDKDFYEGMTAELIIADPQTNAVTTMPMQNLGDHFAVFYDNTVPKTVYAKVRVTNADYTLESLDTEMAFTNTPPDFLGMKEEKLKIDGDKEHGYPLADYFEDVDGDSLLYAIERDSEVVKGKLEGEQLIVTAEKEGQGRITVRASDGQGGTVLGTFTFQVVPLWIYYRDPVVIIGCIFIFLLILYLLLVKKKAEPPRDVVTTAIMPSTTTRFNGARFEGYFLSTISGNDVPVLNWNASYIDQRQMISLGELLSIMDVPEKLPEAYKIYFEAGNNGTVIFHHRTSCIVTLGKRDIPENKKEVLNYEDKLYIVFEDHVTELELRYKRARRRTS